MTRRTVHIPDDLDEEVLDRTRADDSYSAVVQEALREWLKHNDEPEAPADD